MANGGACPKCTYKLNFLEEEIEIEITASGSLPVGATVTDLHLTVQEGKRTWTYPIRKEDGSDVELGVGETYKRRTKTWLYGGSTTPEKVFLSARLKGEGKECVFRDQIH